jgi:hypothetical protein
MHEKLNVLALSLRLMITSRVKRPLQCRPPDRHGQVLTLAPS